MRTKKVQNNVGSAISYDFHSFLRSSLTGGVSHRLKLLLKFSEGKPVKVMFSKSNVQKERELFRKLIYSHFQRKDKCSTLLYSTLCSDLFCTLHLSTLYLIGRFSA